MISFRTPSSLVRRCFFATLLAGYAALPIGAHAQLYDPEADPANGSIQSDNQRTAGQQSTRASATGQLAAPTAPSAQFRADEIPSNSRSRTQPRSALPPAYPGEPSVEPKITASEFETYASQIVDKPLLRFGTNLLVPDARDFTAPPTTTVPPDYRLNPGDELIIGLTGTIQADGLRVTVDSNGRVFVPRIGAVNVAGVRYGDVAGLISQQVGRQYRDFRISLTVAQLHGITVYVTGFAATPGSYTVSSLATLVNGVLAAGGPSNGGSFRSIQLRRSGRVVSTFDLYDLLLNGDKSADVVLQNDDVIFIAPAGPQVAVIGSVNNEAIFEARPGESLADVVRGAGGVNTVADTTRVLVLDAFQQPTGGWHQLSADELRTQPAVRGEILRVLSGIGLVQPLRQQSVLVTVSGEVAKPGRYFLAPGVTLGDALGQAGGLTPQAYPYATVFTRESIRQQQRTSFQRAIADINLLLTAQPLTSVSSSLQLQPARLQAVRSVVAQLEARKPDGRFVLDVPPEAASLPGALVLENNDTIVIPPVPVTVGVFGAVPSPSSFQFVPGVTVGIVLARAGGVQPIGDAKSVFVIRANGSVLGRHKGLSIAALLKQTMLPGDLIFVPLNARRGEAFAKLRDLTSAVFTGALGVGAVAAISR